MDRLTEARLIEQRHQVMDLDADSRYGLPGAACPACPPVGNREYDEYLCGQVAEHRAAGVALSLPLFLGMTQDEYARWAVTGVVPTRVRRMIDQEW